MRNFFAGIVGLITAALYIVNLAVLAFLLCRTFGWNELNPFFDWIFTNINFSLDQYKLWMVWGAYLAIFTPLVALFHRYHRNIKDEDVLFPFFKTIFGVFSGGLKFIIGIIVSAIISEILFNVIIPTVSHGAFDNVWADVKNTFGF